MPFYLLWRCLWIHASLPNLSTGFDTQPEHHFTGIVVLMVSTEDCDSSSTDSNSVVPTTCTNRIIGSNVRLGTEMPVDDFDCKIKWWRVIRHP